MLGDGTRVYTYDQINRLRSSTAGSTVSTLAYEGLGRLGELVGTQGARYLYDGNEISGIATNSATTLINRIVRGPTPDEVVVTYPTTGTPLWLLQDHLGSTIAITDQSGNLISTLAYVEYGQPRSGNSGRFQFTGQLWLPDAGTYHYKARAYHPAFGRFLQPDPIGYVGGANLYAYAADDPANNIDPEGLLQIIQQCSSREVRVDDGYANSVNIVNSCVYSFVGGGSSFTGDRQGLGGGGGEARGRRAEACAVTPGFNPALQVYGFSLGIQDSFTFGTTSAAEATIPGAWGDAAEAAVGTAGYEAGSWAGFIGGFSRLAYAGAASSFRFMGGEAASLARNNLKRVGRLGFGGNYRMYSYEELLAKYGSDRAVARAASRKNPGVNTVGAVAATSSTLSMTECP